MTKEQLREEYFARLREIARKAKEAGYVGKPVPLDPHS